MTCRVSLRREAIKAPARHYVVDRFSLGLMIGADGREEGIAMSHEERALAKPAQEVSTDIPPTPAMDNWANVRSLGVTGDGKTDDTDALLAAIEKHAVLFFPSGTYRVSRPLTLKPDTALIGLNPGTTQISLLDGSPAFGGEGSPVGIIVAPKDGRNIVRSIAITTGSSNPRAAAMIWMAGKNSLLDDVSFPGQRFFGSGFRGFGFPRRPPTTAPLVRPNFEVSPAAADLLITNGGGGIFRNNWPHGSNAKIGLRVENTDTPGKIYQMSVEHHMRVEAEFHNVRNWEIYAFQTEEENPAGANAYALDIEDSRGLLFANTYMYRVSRNVLPKTLCDRHASLRRYRFRKRESVQPDAARIRQRGLQRSQWRLRAFALLHALRGECGCEATRSLVAAGLVIRTARHCSRWRVASAMRRA